MLASAASAPGDRRAEPRHRLCHETGAAAHIQQIEPGEGLARPPVPPELRGDLRADVVEPAGVELVQRRGGAVRVPPARRHAVELVDFRRIHLRPYGRIGHSVSLR
jgi:hypothetical protein